MGSSERRKRSRRVKTLDDLGKMARSLTALMPAFEKTLSNDAKDWLFLGVSAACCLAVLAWRLSSDDNPRIEQGPITSAQTAVPPPASARDMGTTPLPQPDSAEKFNPRVPDASSIERDSAGYWHLDFSQLAGFPFHAPENLPPDRESTACSSLKASVPASIRNLDGQLVRIAGYMLPDAVKNGRVSDLIIIRSPLVCCFGVQPAQNEWIIVKMRGPGVEQKMDTPLYFYGRLHVAPHYENGAFSALYELDGETVGEPKIVGVTG